MVDKKLERKTLQGFIAAACLLALVSAVAIFAVHGYTRTASELAHSHEVISELEGLSAALNAAEAARRGYMATGVEFYLKERDQALTKVRDHLLQAQALTADNREQQQLLGELETQLAQRSEQSDASVQIARTQGLQAGQQELRRQELPNMTMGANATIEAVAADERRLINNRRGGDVFWADALISAFAVLLLTMAIVLTWLCVRIRREFAERSRAALALDQANTGLAAANRELESFSYSVSHDLRSPLRAIDGYSLMLEEDYAVQLDDTGRRYIQTIRAGTQRMAALIDDLLTFSKLSRQELNRQRVDMTTLARRVAAEVLQGTPDPKPAVSIDELPSIPGDPALLRQVWANLLSNAVKYSSRSNTPQVNVSAERTGRSVRFEVRDNGVGFDMKYADKLFGVFQRLHAAEDYPGTGVGLAIVQRIVARHQGAVSAQGERGKGATFGFTLPSEV